MTSGLLIRMDLRRTANQMSSIPTENARKATVCLASLEVECIQILSDK